MLRATLTCAEALPDAAAAASSLSMATPAPNEYAVASVKHGGGGGGVRVGVWCHTGGSAQVHAAVVVSRRCHEARQYLVSGLSLSGGPWS